jgi:hypothetical protein
MKKLKGLAFVLPAVVCMVAVVAAPVGVGAHNGEDHSRDTAQHVSETSRIDKLREAESNIRQRGNALLEEARETIRTKTAEQRQAICEQRKNGLQRKVNSLASNGQRYLDRVSTVFTKAQTFQVNDNLDVAGYEELVTAANASKSAATASVDALKSLKPAVDCALTTIPNDIAAFKAAALQARADLNAYKEDVKALLAALKAASQANRTGGTE